MIRNTRKPKGTRAAKTPARRQHRKSRAGAKGGGKIRPKHQPQPQTESDTIEALLISSAQALGLPIEPSWLGGVKFNLQLILRLAATVDEFPLPDDTEPAPVFHA
jgi:hypothetical protein